MLLYYNFPRLTYFNNPTLADLIENIIKSYLHSNTLVLLTSNKN